MNAITKTRALENQTRVEAVLLAVLDLRPRVPVARMWGLAHYPQLESPEETIEVVERLLS